MVENRKEMAEQAREEKIALARKKVHYFLSLWCFTAHIFTEMQMNTLLNCPPFQLRKFQQRKPSTPPKLPEKPPDIVKENLEIENGIVSVVKVFVKEVTKPRLP